ncbi:alpha/beta hydrolase, partial [Pseudoxanthomonas sp. SGD-10]
KNADQYNIDRRNIILIGGSAGAHLALLVGLQSVNPIFAGDCNYSKIRIAGIISKYGPTDLMTWEPARNPKKASSSWLATRINDVEFIEALSPVNYVSKRTKNIPVLFIHGKQDNTVPITQSEVLYHKLLQNGNQTTLHVVENGKHGNFSKEDTRVMDYTMIDFVRRCIER